MVRNFAQANAGRRRRGFSLGMSGILSRGMRMESRGQLVADEIIGARPTVPRLFRPATVAQTASAEFWHTTG
jgi:hypothetical protein